MFGIPALNSELLPENVAIQQLKLQLTAAMFTKKIHANQMCNSAKQSKVIYRAAISQLMPWRWN